MNTFRKPSEEEDLILKRVRYRAQSQFPYYAKGIFGYRTLVDPEVVGITSSPRGIIYVGEHLLRDEGEVRPSIPESEMAGRLIHAIEHVFANHSVRGEHRQGERWNLSTDLEINSRMAGSIAGSRMVSLPEAWIRPGNLDMEEGRAAETYFNLLRDRDEENPFQCDGGNGGPHSAAEEGEHAMTDISLESIRMDMSRELLEHAKSNGVPGTMQGLVEYASAQLDTQRRVNWRRELPSVLRGSISTTEASPSDYSHRRPSRRNLDPSIHLPGTIGAKSRILVVLDSSISALGDRSQWNAQVSEVMSLVRQSSLGRDVVITSLSTVRGPLIPVERFDPAAMGVATGGTDMRLAWDIVDELNEDNVRDPFTHLIIVTDGETPWPPHPRCPEVISLAVIMSRGHHADTPAWLRSVVVED